jgi:Right handed beta helix region
MTRTIFISAALSLAAALPAMPAQAAGVNHTFVSAAGSDSNNCASVTTPCRHFANAYAVTAPNGEIFVLDPANYGAFTITGPVSIEGHGWASFAAVSGQAAITINANSGDKINIIGVVLDGVHIANTTGIQFNSGGSLNVKDSVIRNFTGDGISFGPNSSNPSQLIVSNSSVSDNGGHGVGMATSGTGTMIGVLDHVQMGNNATGLFVNTSTQTINVTITDSVSANNSADGIEVESSTQAIVMVRNSTIVNNGGTGLVATFSGATIRVTRSTITGNNTGWSGTGAVYSYGDNNIDGNVSVNTEPLGPLPYK